MYGRQDGSGYGWKRGGRGRNKKYPCPYTKEEEVGISEDIVKKIWRGIKK